ncbi:MAG: extracellular solute-binding protein [Eubacteriales bacterium]|nr:extracellular solute-binding protein [Eubacteriales bacterium]
MFRRILCRLLTICLLLAPVCSQAEASFSMAGYDGNESTHDWSTNEFFTRMEERTGITFTYSEYTKSADWQTAKEQMFATGELPDVLFKAALTTEETIRYTESGQLIDLKPLLAEYAPNLWALLNEHPDWLEAITLPSGKIGALPSIQTVPTQNLIWINQDWLTKLNLTAPTDLESLKTVLIAFRDQDPNGNGKKDEIPMSFLGPWELKFLSHAYGVVVNDYNVYLDDGGKVRFWPEEDSFIELVRTLRSFYKEGLLDPNGFQTSDVLRQVTDEKADVCYGMYFAPTALSLLTYTQAEAYRAMAPLVYDGKQVYRDLLGQVTRGAFAITSACTDPGALLQWVDYLYTEEGAVEAMVGKEGDVYITTDGGQWQWKGGVENVSSTQLTELSVYDTGEMPWLFPQDFYSRYNDDSVSRITEELTAFAAYTKSPFPTYSLTEEQNAEVLALQNELGRYVDECLARFVLGEVEMTDETIAEFKQGLLDRGSEQMTGFWQKIADE